LKKLIPYAVKKGYRLVTLNEMFGYPDNEVSEWKGSFDERIAPTLAPYESVMIKLGEGTYDYRVKGIQERLLELGYLDAEPDGIFGAKTKDAIERFQADAGLEVTGDADIDTQVKLKEADALAMDE